MCVTIWVQKMTQEELIKERREKVSHLLMQGHTEISIAKQLDVSRETIVRDVKVLKGQSFSWLSNLAKDGLCFEFKLVLDELRNLRIQLVELLEITPTVNERIRLIREIEINCEIYLKYLLDGPGVQIMKIACKHTREDFEGVPTAFKT